MSFPYEPWRIPASWAWTSIGTVADVIGGGTPTTTDNGNFEGGDIAWITPADLSGYKAKYISHGARNITQKGLAGSAARLMPKGTVLFSSRAPIGYVAIAAKPITTNQGFKSFVLPSGLDPEFVYYYLHRAKDLALELASGTTFLEISGSSAQKLPLVIAPEREQHRIVEAVESYLTRLDDAVATLERVQQNLKRYRASVLKAAVEGRLVPTEAELARQEGRDYQPASEVLSGIETPARPTRYRSRSRTVIPGHAALAVGNPAAPLPEGWQWVALADVARLESGHTPSRRHPEWWGGDVRWIGIKDAHIHHGGMIHQTLQRTNELGLANSAARILPAGTVCLSRTASVGYVVVMGRPMATSQDFVNWICTPAVDPNWLRVVFLADPDALRRFGKGTTHTTIYYPEVLSFHIALPPLNEQRRIAEEVDRLASVTTQVAEVAARNLQRIKRVRQSILKWAFEGKLVPQDPNDEPASVLLDRIKAERAKMGEGTKRNRRGGSKRRER